MPLLETSFHAWLRGRREQCDMRVREIAGCQSREWTWDDHSIRHRSGGFFSVVGTAVRLHGVREPGLDQPLIDQPEIGILGFALRRRGDGQSELLVQAKPEPGNIGLVQAAPTVQATESNYRCRHRGRHTPFLEWFTRDHGTRLADSLQSEQGTRFLGKYNRNVLVDVSGDDAAWATPDERYQWVAVRELCARLTTDFEVNTDARSVLISGDWRALARPSGPFGGDSHEGPHQGLRQRLRRSYEACSSPPLPIAESVEGQLRRLRASAGFEIERVDLAALTNWHMTEMGLRTDRADGFDVRQFNIEASEREVTHWDQPLVCSEGWERVDDHVAAHEVGRVTLACQEHDGVLRFLFVARPEVGFREKLQYGPTVQQDSLQSQQHSACLDPTLREIEADVNQRLQRAQTLHSCLHSDEGGRFYRCIARYSICLLHADDVIRERGQLLWLNLGEIEQLAQRRGVFTNEARSLISLLLAHL